MLLIKVRVKHFGEIVMDRANMVFGHFIWKSCRYGCESELLVIPSAANALCSPLNAANTVLFSSVHLTPCSVNLIPHKERCPLLAVEILIVLFHLFIFFFFPPLLLRDQWSRCNTYYRGFQDLRISWRWLEINLHNPPWSSCSPSPLRLLSSFYLTLGAPQNGRALREAPRLFKKRAWLEGSGGYGTCDHEACGPIPAAFS